MLDKIRKKGKILNSLYLILILATIGIIIFQLVNNSWHELILCSSLLLSFGLIYFIDLKSKIDLPDLLEALIMIFNFLVIILGESLNFYKLFFWWDSMLHIMSGFICAAIGYSLFSILNRNKEKQHYKINPIFMFILAFSFSMTIGLFWEFFEFAGDSLFKTDMQNDNVVKDFSSIYLQKDNENKSIKIKDIIKTEIYSMDSGKEKITVIKDGYLDIGIIDTMKDLIDNGIGAIVFSVLGFLYTNNDKKYRVIKNLLPKLKYL